VSKRAEAVTAEALGSPRKPAEARGVTAEARGVTAEALGVTADARGRPRKRAEAHGGRKGSTGVVSWAASMVTVSLALGGMWE